jgi:hypothetical protein
MFNRVSEVAEKLATNVSRREFMGRQGKGALVLADTLGAMLALPESVQAGACGCINGGGFCLPRRFRINHGGQPRPV